MSIFIRGMELPKPGAYTCELGVLDDNTAVLTIYTPVSEPQKSYTLVPVPPHGRLIDADSLAKDDWYLNRYVSDSNGCWIENMTLEDAPTIIPADEPFGKSEQLNM